MTTIHQHQHPCQQSGTVIPAIDNFTEDLAVNFEAAQARTSRRLRLARAMLLGAADATSARIACRVILDWFGGTVIPMAKGGAE